MAGKKFGNAPTNDEDIGQRAHSSGMSDEDGPHADDARNTPNNDRSLKAGSGSPGARGTGQKNQP